MFNMPAVKLFKSGSHRAPSTNTTTDTDTESVWSYDAKHDLQKTHVASITTGSTHAAKNGTSTAKGVAKIMESMSTLPSSSAGGLR